MQSSIDKVNALSSNPVALVIDEVVNQKSDPKTSEQLSELSKEHGPDSDIVRLLAAHKSAKDDEIRDELRRILDESARQKQPLLPMNKEHAAMLAAKFGITNREVGDWRRRRIVDMASESLVNDEDIEREVYLHGSALDTMTAKLVKEGELVRDGHGYRTPETATAS